MGGCYPNSSTLLEDLFQRDHVDHDIIVIGSQEAEKSIAKSTFFPGKEHLNEALTVYLGKP
jgi:hypothetical protein